MDNARSIHSFTLKFLVKMHNENPRKVSCPTNNIDSTVTVCIRR